MHVSVKHAFAIAATALALSGPIAPAAHAEGWLAKHFVKPLFGKKVAEELDKKHEELGKPLDKAAAAAAVAAVSAATGIPVPVAP